MKALLVQLRTAAIAMAVLTVLVTVVPTGSLYLGAQVLFPEQARGSLIVREGSVVGSRLIAQSFVASRYFHPRPSAAGDGYDGARSAGTNLGPSNDKLIRGAPGFAGVRELAAAYREENGLPDGAPIPVDAVTRSGSGLDPHISVEDAVLQMPRVARSRGMSDQAVRALVDAHTEGRDLWIFGEPRVNVLLLDLALDDASRRMAPPERAR